MYIYVPGHIFSTFVAGSQGSKDFEYTWLPYAEIARETITSSSFVLVPARSNVTIWLPLLYVTSSWSTVMTEAGKHVENPSVCRIPPSIPTGSRPSVSNAAAGNDVGRIAMVYCEVRVLEGSRRDPDGQLSWIQTKKGESRRGHHAAVNNSLQQMVALVVAVNSVLMQTLNYKEN